jgi:hypothetical protein
MLIAREGIKALSLEILVLLSPANLRLKVPGSQKLLPRYVGPFVVEAGGDLCIQAEFA